MTASVTPLIQVRGLGHTYLRGTPLEVRSLRHVDLEVYAGDVLGIVGPTGSGKSTLLQHLNGLLRPQQGEVRVNGVPLSDPAVDMRAIRQRVGLLFQSPEDQLFERYAGDDVAFGPRNLGLPVEEVRERVRKALDDVGLPFDYKDRLIAELSEGQRRRLALAGVLAMQPQVLVLDEPTAGLDPQGRRELLGVLSGWRAQDRRAVVLASHNMEDVTAVCTHVHVLVEGTVVLRGSPREVFHNADLLARYGLAIPAATETMHMLRGRGYPVSTNVLFADEAAREIEGLFGGRAI